MRIRKVSEIEPIRPEGTEGVEMRVAIGAEDHAPHFILRHFTLAPGAATPRHAHDWEHEIYVISGRGEAWNGERLVPFGGGETIFVPPNREHQFRNTGEGPLQFICLIPNPA